MQAAVEAPGFIEAGGAAAGGGSGAFAIEGAEFAQELGRTVEVLDQAAELAGEFFGVGELFPIEAAAE